MKIEVLTIPEQRVAYLRHVGPYHEVGDTWAQLMGWAAQKGLLGKAACFGVCHDEPGSTPAAELRYDACVDITDSDLEVDGGLEVQSLDGGTFAKVVHRGSYENLGDTYGQFMGVELGKQGFKPAPGACREVYVNNCQDTPADQLITEIMAPIEAPK